MILWPCGMRISGPGKPTAYRGGTITVPQIGRLDTPVVPIAGAKAQGASGDHEPPYWEAVGVSPGPLQTLRGVSLQGWPLGPSIPIGKVAQNNSMPRLVCRISSRTHNMVGCWQDREWGQMEIHADWLKRTSCPATGNRVLGALYELPGETRAVAGQGSPLQPGSSRALNPLSVHLAD
ncbi:hypothetical protein BDZ97DRAFT_2060810 [Flammula alnicola]|nr:hypothetical protein BDZ97DRAFT_2060810 [Flammula alnicola]